MIYDLPIKKQELAIIQLMQDKSHEMRKEDASSPSKLTSTLSLKRSHWSHWSMISDITVSNIYFTNLVIPKFAYIYSLFIVFIRCSFHQDGLRTLV